MPKAPVTVPGEYRHTCMTGRWLFLCYPGAPGLAPLRCCCCSPVLQEVAEKTLPNVHGPSAKQRILLEDTCSFRTWRSTVGLKQRDVESRTSSVPPSQLLSHQHHYFMG